MKKIVPIKQKSIFPKLDELDIALVYQSQKHQLFSALDQNIRIVQFHAQELDQLENTLNSVMLACQKLDNAIQGKPKL